MVKNDLTPTQRRVNSLRAQGYNPIHLFGNVYLVRHESTQFSKWPLYLIKVIKG